MSCIRATLLLALAVSAQCAELSIAPVTAQPGSTAPIAVRFVSSGTHVAALQFDLSYDPTLAFAATAASSATSAGKDVFSATVTTGHTRLLVAGTNQYTLGDGPVIELTAFVSSSAAAEPYALRLTNSIASDPQGNNVSLTSSDGIVTVDGSVNSPTSGIFTHAASGGGWTTSFTFLNLSPTANRANLTFWNDDGTPLALPVTFALEPGRSPTTSSSTSFVIPANGVALVKTGLPQDFAAAVGWARLAAPPGVVGSATFSYHSSTGLNLEAVVPMETRTPTSFVLPFDNTAELSTGVALANGSETSLASIEVTARDAAGRQVLLDSISLPVLGHTSFMLADKYPSLIGIVGSLEFHNSSGGGISVLGLLMNQSGSLTSIPPESK